VTCERWSDGDQRAVGHGRKLARVRPGRSSPMSADGDDRRSRSGSMSRLRFRTCDTSGVNGAARVGATVYELGRRRALGDASSRRAATVGVRHLGHRGLSTTPPRVTLGSEPTMVHQFCRSRGDHYWMQRNDGAIAASGASVAQRHVPSGRYRLNIHLRDSRQATRRTRRAPRSRDGSCRGATAHGAATTPRPPRQRRRGQECSSGSTAPPSTQSVNAPLRDGGDTRPRPTDRTRLTLSSRRRGQTRPSRQ